MSALTLLLGSELKAHQRCRPLVRVAGCAVATDQFGDPAMRVPTVAMTQASGTPRTSEVTGAVQRAMAQAVVEHANVDLIEMADNTARHVQSWPELFGFAEPRATDAMLERGDCGVGGRLPLNPFGGFLSFGEATTAQGLLQVCELSAWQLRGEAIGHQVEGARVGLSAVLGLGANGVSEVLTR